VVLTKLEQQAADRRRNLSQLLDILDRHGFPTLLGSFSPQPQNNSGDSSQVVRLLLPCRKCLLNQYPAEPRASRRAGVAERSPLPPLQRTWSDVTNGRVTSSRISAKVDACATRYARSNAGQILLVNLECNGVTRPLDYCCGA